MAKITTIKFDPEPGPEAYAWQEGGFQVVPTGSPETAETAAPGGYLAPPEPDDGGFVTTDSGERQRWETGMQRDVSKGKPRFDLCFPLEVPFDKQLITRFARLMERGAEKYDARNWEQARTEEELQRYRESAIRHFMQWFLGVEDGEDHAAAVMFNLMGAEYVRGHLRGDY